MFVAYFSPLAPAAMLLLSAFILSNIMPLWPSAWREQPWVQNFLPAALVGVVILILLGLRFTFGADTAGAGLQELSSWQFSAQTGGILNIRADELSLPFLILTVLLLLVVALITAPVYQPSNLPESDTTPHWPVMTEWFVIGAGACLVFVSANLLTVSYGLLLFDVMLAFYWLKRAHHDLAIARLFLGLLSAGAFVLAEVSPQAGVISGVLLLSLALWLRLGIYPFIEIASQEGWPDDENLAYLGLSLLVGLYLVIRVLSGPLPLLMVWLTALVMLFSGLLTWLTDRSRLWLIYLLLTEILFLFLVLPLPKGVVVAAALSLILSLIGLWVTPQLGRPEISERAWLWPYLPAVAATVTLVGLPLTLGWGMRLVVYQALLSFDNLLLIGCVLLAEMLAFSGLTRFWLMLWGEKNGNRSQLALGMVVTVPFLIPGLAPFILARITRLELSTANFGQSLLTLTFLAVIVGGGITLEYYRVRLLNFLQISPERWTSIARLGWVWPQSGQWLNKMGKLLLRVEVILEGQHYIGWAIFSAIVGTLIVLLRT